MIPDIFIGFLVGIGLASAIGFRVFIPLFLVSLSAYFEWIPFDLGEKWEWLGSSMAVVAFGIGMLVETLGYYIPWVDNLLDTITAPTAAIAGTMMMAVQLDTIDSEFLKWALAIIAGGGTASLVSGATAGSRATSSATTGGVANPVISTAEIGTAGTLGATSLLSLNFPVLLVVLVVFLALTFFVIYRVYKGFGWIRKKITK